MNTPELDLVLERALDLTVPDRLRLIETVAASIHDQIRTSAMLTADEGESWGQHVIDLVNQLDMSAWENLNIEDSSEWVMNLRSRIEGERRVNWSDQP